MKKRLIQRLVLQIKIMKNYLKTLFYVQSPTYLSKTNGVVHASNKWYVLEKTLKVISFVRIIDTLE